MENKKPYQKLAWTSTALLILAATLAAFNVHPQYVWMFIIASSMWTLTGILWKETSLIVLNAGLTVIYIVGMLW